MSVMSAYSTSRPGTPVVWYVQLVSLGSRSSSLKVGAVWFGVPMNIRQTVSSTMTELRREERDSWMRNSASLDRDGAQTGLSGLESGGTDWYKESEFSAMLIRATTNKMKPKFVRTDL